jgi:transposase, IS5 family
VDKEGGLVYHVEATHANVYNVAVTPKLLTGEEEIVYSESGYLVLTNVKMLS